MFQFIYNNIHDTALRNHLLWMLFKKRTLDVVASFLSLVCLTPLFLVVALLIKLTSKGPVLYWQKRVGWDAKEFDFPKFRSMRSDSDATRAALLAQNQHGADGVTFKMKNDPRVTWIGKYIRKYSIDELPQLWCVLKGDMSLVGPRPPLPSEVAKYTSSDKMRLMALPGITGFWQVSGRSDVAFPEQVDMDLMYMSHYSLRLDLVILWKTFAVVVTGKGSY